MTNAVKENIDMDAFAYAVLRHADGWSWEKIAEVYPMYTPEQLEKSVTEFLHDLKFMRIKTYKPVKRIDVFKYEDSGCHKSPSCLKCELPKCFYDTKEENLKKHHWTEKENEYIKSVYQNKTVREIALEMNLPSSAIREHCSILGLLKRADKKEKFKYGS